MPRVVPPVDLRPDPLGEPDRGRENCVGGERDVVLRLLPERGAAVLGPGEPRGPERLLVATPPEAVAEVVFATEDRDDVPVGQTQIEDTHHADAKWSTRDAENSNVQKDSRARRWQRVTSTANNESECFVRQRCSRGVAKVAATTTTEQERFVRRRLVAVGDVVVGAVVPEQGRRVVQEELVVALADVVEVPAELGGLVGREHHRGANHVPGTLHSGGWEHCSMGEGAESALLSLTRATDDKAACGHDTFF